MTRIARAMGILALAGCPTPEFSGTPTLIVGTGEFAYEDVISGQEVPIDAGPQGGYHVWFGVQTTGMDPRGLRLDSFLFTEPADTGEAAVMEGETFFHYPQMFAGSNAGLWETAGLIHQVERNRVANRKWRLTVVATDRDGREAESSMVITPIR